MATVSTDSSEPIRRVIEIPGFGPIGVGSFVAALGDGQAFKCGRVVSSWLGLTPRQHSSGGKPILFGINKRGNCYLRIMLVHGARSVIQVCWRLVTTLRSSNPSFGWMITTTDTVHLKPYLSCQLNVFGIEAGFKHKRLVTH